MLTLCGSSDGSHSPRAGGTIQAAVSVSTCMIPLVACRSWARLCMCRGMWSPARHARAITATRRGASSRFLRYSGILFGIGWPGPFATKFDRTSPACKGYTGVRTRESRDMTIAADEHAKRRTISFLNWAHGLDHFVLLIYPTVVLGVGAVYGRPFSELIVFSTAAFIAFGVFSLPAGLIADRWSRRNMMGVFYIGVGLSLALAAFAPNLIVLAVALFAIGVFAAIYHPVGMAILIEASQAKGRTLAFNGVCGNLGVSLAAGISALLAAWVGWRAAFLAPAALALATGVLYLWLTPDDRHHRKKRQSIPAVRLPARAMAV